MRYKLSTVILSGIEYPVYADNNYYRYMQWICEFPNCGENSPYQFNPMVCRDANF